MIEIIDDITGRCTMLKPRHVTCITYTESTYNGTNTYSLFIDFANGNSITLTKFRNKETLDSLKKIMSIK